MKRICMVLVLGFFVCLMCRLALAQDISREFALFEEIPMVVSAAKKLQPISQAPASVYVVTGEDIKQRGSLDLWSALREVPGLDVNTATIGQAEISMRGFSDLLTNKTLILVDGRSMYMPQQGLQYLELLTEQPEEIDRIEIVKGPVASLYGANANLGLINIITKAPDEIKGGMVSATGGTKDAGLYSFVYGNTHKDLSYKFSGGWEQADGFKPRNDNLTRAGRWNTELKYKINDDSYLSFSSGMSQTSWNVLTNSAQIENLWYYGPDDFRHYYLQSVYENGGLKTRLYWIREHVSYDTAKIQLWVNQDTIDEETTYAFNLGDKHSLLAGAGARFYGVKANVYVFPDDNEKHTQALWNMYLQDEYKLLEKLTLVGSARIDHYPLNGYNPSLRLAAVYPHDEKNVFRASVGSSFRAPTISDFHLYNSIVVVDGFPPQVTRGNKDLDPEKYLTVELGYQGRYLKNRLRPFADLFWTKIKDLIDTYVTGGGVLGLDAAFRNDPGKAYSSGGEIGAEYDVTKQMTLIGNYAYNNVQYNDVPSIFFSPHNKVNLGFKLKVLNDKLSAKLLAHYVSGTKSTFLTGGETDSYIMGNLWIGYQVNNALEVSLAGYNIFHDVHTEEPEGDEIGTRILGTVRVKF